MFYAHAEHIARAMPIESAQKNLYSYFQSIGERRVGDITGGDDQPQNLAGAYRSLGSYLGFLGTEGDERRSDLVRPELKKLFGSLVPDTLQTLTHHLGVGITALAVLPKNNDERAIILNKAVWADKSGAAKINAIAHELTHTQEHRFDDAFAQIEQHVAPLRTRLTEAVIHNTLLPANSNPQHAAIVRNAAFSKVQALSTGIDANAANAAATDSVHYTLQPHEIMARHAGALLSGDAESLRQQEEESGPAVTAIARDTLATHFPDVFSPERLAQRTHQEDAAQLDTIYATLGRSAEDLPAAQQKQKQTLTALPPEATTPPPAPAARPAKAVASSPATTPPTQDPPLSKKAHHAATAFSDATDTDVNYAAFSNVRDRSDNDAWDSVRLSPLRLVDQMSAEQLTHATPETIGELLKGLKPFHNKEIRQHAITPLMDYITERQHMLATSTPPPAPPALPVEARAPTKGGVVPKALPPDKAATAGMSQQEYEDYFLGGGSPSATSPAALPPAPPKQAIPPVSSFDDEEEGQLDTTYRAEFDGGAAPPKGPPSRNRPPPPPPPPDDGHDDVDYGMSPEEARERGFSGNVHMGMADFRTFIETAGRQKPLTFFDGLAEMQPNGDLSISTFGQRSKADMRDGSRDRYDSTRYTYGTAEAHVNAARKADDISVSIPTDPEAAPGLALHYDPAAGHVAASYGGDNARLMVSDEDGKLLAAHEALTRVNSPIPDAATEQPFSIPKNAPRGNTWTQYADFFRGQASPQQRAVMTDARGKRRAINADAGVGKTYTEVGTLAHLLEAGVEPSQMTMMSFTGNAVKEFKGRLETYFGDDAKDVKGMNIRTVDSFAQDIVRNSDAGVMKAIMGSGFHAKTFTVLGSSVYERANDRTTGMPREVIEDDQGHHPGDDVMMMWDLLAKDYDTIDPELRTTLKARAHQDYQFGQYAHELDSVHQARYLRDQSIKIVQTGHFGTEYKEQLNLLEQAGEYITPLHHLVADYAIKYQAEQGKRNRIGQEEMSLAAFKALQAPANATGKKSLLSRVRAKFEHTFIDEGENLNPVQHALINMASNGRGMTIAGDRKQGIYAWRGAQENFDEKFHVDEVMPLSESRRSRQGILRAVNAIFGTNTTLPKEEQARRQGGEVSYTFMQGKETGLWRKENEQMASDLLKDLYANPEKMHGNLEDHEIMMTVPTKARQDHLVGILAPQLANLGMQVKVRESSEQLDQKALNHVGMSAVPEEGTPEYRIYEPVRKRVQDAYDAKRGVGISTIHQTQGLAGDWVYAGGVAGEGAGQVLTWQLADKLGKPGQESDDPEVQAEKKNQWNLAYVQITRARDKLRMYGSGQFESRFMNHVAEQLGLTSDLQDMSVARPASASSAPGAGTRPPIASAAPRVDMPDAADISGIGARVMGAVGQAMGRTPPPPAAPQANPVDATPPPPPPAVATPPAGASFTPPPNGATFVPNAAAVAASTPPPPPPAIVASVQAPAPGPGPIPVGNVAIPTDMSLSPAALPAGAVAPPAPPAATPPAIPADQAGAPVFPGAGVGSPVMTPPPAASAPPSRSAGIIWPSFESRITPLTLPTAAGSSAGFTVPESTRIESHRVQTISGLPAEAAAPPATDTPPALPAEAAAPPASETPPALPAGAIDINSADLQSLQRLPGIGKTKGQAIIDHRHAHGPFTHADDLRQVTGIGPALMGKLQGHVTAVPPALPALPVEAIAPPAVATAPSRDHALLTDLLAEDVPPAPPVRPADVTAPSRDHALLTDLLAEDVLPVLPAAATPASTGPKRKGRRVPDAPPPALPVEATPSPRRRQRKERGVSELPELPAEAMELLHDMSPSSAGSPQRGRRITGLDAARVAPPALPAEATRVPLLIAETVAPTADQNRQRRTLSGHAAMSAAPPALPADAPPPIATVVPPAPPPATSAPPSLPHGAIGAAIARHNGNTATASQTEHPLPLGAAIAQHAAPGTTTPPALPAAALARGPLGTAIAQHAAPGTTTPPALPAAALARGPLGTAIAQHAAHNRAAQPPANPPGATTPPAPPSAPLPAASGGAGHIPPPPPHAASATGAPATPGSGHGPPAQGATPTVHAPSAGSSVSGGVIPVHVVNANAIAQHLSTAVKNLMNAPVQNIQGFINGLGPSGVLSTAQAVGAAGQAGQLNAHAQAALAQRLPALTAAALAQGNIAPVAAALARANYSAGAQMFTAPPPGIVQQPVNPNFAGGRSASGGGGGGGGGGQSLTAASLQFAHNLSRVGADSLSLFENNLRVGSTYAYVASRAASAKGTTFAQVDARATQYGGENSPESITGLSKIDVAEMQRYVTTPDDLKQVGTFSLLAGIDAGAAAKSTSQLATQYGNLTAGNVANIVETARQGGTTDEAALMTGAHSLGTFTYAVDSAGKPLNSEQRLAQNLSATQVLGTAGYDVDRATRMLYENMALPDIRMATTLKGSHDDMGRRANPRVTQKELDSTFTNEGYWNWQIQQAQLTNQVQTQPLQLQHMRVMNGVSGTGQAMFQPSPLPGSGSYAAQVMAAPLRTLSEADITYRTQKTNLDYESRNLDRQGAMLTIQERMTHRDEQMSQLNLTQQALGLSQSTQMLGFKSQEFALTKQSNRLELTSDALDLAVLTTKAKYAPEQTALALEKSTITYGAQLRELGFQQRMLPLQQQQLAVQRESGRANLTMEHESLAFRKWYDTALYGTVGADRSYRASLAMEGGQLGMSRNGGMQQESAANTMRSQVAATPVMGIQNEEFYSGIQHQLSQLQLGRSQFRGEASYNESVQYLKKQTDLYERRMQVEDAARTFSYHQSDKQLAISEKEFAIQEQMLIIQMERITAEIADAQRLIPIEKRLTDIAHILDIAELAQLPARLAIEIAKLNLKGKGIAISEAKTAAEIANENLILASQTKLLALQQKAIDDQIAYNAIQLTNQTDQLAKEKANLASEIEINNRQGELLSNIDTQNLLMYQLTQTTAEMLNFVLNSRKTFVDKGIGTENGDIASPVTFAKNWAARVAAGTLDPQELQRRFGGLDEGPMKAIITAAMDGSINAQDEKNILAAKTEVARKPGDPSVVDGQNADATANGAFNWKEWVKIQQDLAIAMDQTAAAGLTLSINLEKDKAAFGEWIGALSGPAGQAGDIAGKMAETAILLQSIGALIKAAGAIGTGAAAGTAGAAIAGGGLLAIVAVIESITGMLAVAVASKLAIDSVTELITAAGHGWVLDKNTPIANAVQNWFVGNDGTKTVNGLSAQDNQFLTEWNKTHSMNLADQGGLSADNWAVKGSAALLGITPEAATQRYFTSWLKDPEHQKAYDAYAQAHPATKETPGSSDPKALDAAAKAYADFWQGITDWATGNSKSKLKDTAVTAVEDWWKSITTWASDSSGKSKPKDAAGTAVEGWWKSVTAWATGNSGKSKPKDAAGTAVEDWWKSVIAWATGNSKDSTLKKEATNSVTAFWRGLMTWATDNTKNTKPQKDATNALGKWWESITGWLTKNSDPPPDGGKGLKKLAVGMTNVSYDQNVRIHRGEAVLTTNEASAYRAGLSSVGNAPSLLDLMKTMSATFHAQDQAGRVTPVATVMPGDTEVAPKLQGGDTHTYTINVPITVNGEMSQDALHTLKAEMIDGIASAIEKLKKR